MKLPRISLQLYLRLALVTPVVVLVLVNALVLQGLLQSNTQQSIDRQILASGNTIALVVQGQDLTSHLQQGPLPDSVQHHFPVWSLLRNIQTQNHLTYIYVFLPNADGSITYALDGSPEGESCYPGQREEIPAENREGIQRIWSHGGTFVSKVLKFEEWGFLKVSAAPVLNTLGKPYALVGSDLEISVITKRVRTVIWLAIGISLLALLLGVVAAMRTGKQFGQLFHDAKEYGLEQLRSETLPSQSRPTLPSNQEFSQGLFARLVALLTLTWILLTAISLVTLYYTLQQNRATILQSWEIALTEGMQWRAVQHLPPWTDTQLQQWAQVAGARTVHYSSGQLTVDWNPPTDWSALWVSLGALLFAYVVILRVGKMFLGRLHYKEHIVEIQDLQRIDRIGQAYHRKLQSELTQGRS